MNSFLSSFSFNNLSLPSLPQLNLSSDMFRMPSGFQGVASFVTGLQNIIIKQQSIINSLVAKSHTKDKVEKTEKGEESPEQPQEPLNIKLEADLSKSSPQALGSVDRSSITTEEYAIEREEILKSGPKIKRRNGFKPRSKKINTKIKELEEEDNQISASPSKSALDLKLKNASKAKHLWVNYGRRILEYAINQTKGGMQNRIKQLVGKLNSKKDFERTFQILNVDSNDDKLFKTLLGRLAIYFVKHKASPTFENSKYKQEMITQRHTVAAWIERLIND